MASRDDHDLLVAQFYASAMGDVPWTATLKKAADVFLSKAAAIQISDPDKKFLAVENYGYSMEFAMNFYGSEVFANDPRVPYYYSVQPGGTYCDRTLYDVEEMDRNPWCQLSCEILNSKYQMGSVAGLADGSFAAFSFLRTEKEGHV
jgi:hypothetical protein